MSGAVIIGRVVCPEKTCGFQAAHIKQREGKHPYRHCPSCGLLTQARSHDQARHIMAGMRPEGAGAPQPPATHDPIVIPAGAAPAAAAGAAPGAAAAATPAASPQPQPRRRPGAELWASLMKKGGTGG